MKTGIALICKANCCTSFGEALVGIEKSIKCCIIFYQILSISSSKEHYKVNVKG